MGGYDANKFIPNNVSFGLITRSGLPLQLQSIMSDTATTLLAEPIDVLLDSTVPYIYLPAESCALFENAFGLIWNDTSQLYLLNETQHTLLKESNPELTFKLGNGRDADSVDITLPYAAFDLTATWPIVNATPYFPLKRAANSTQYKLGRTFFQEAYVIADYERGNFSVSQCDWDSVVEQDIVSILPPSNSTVTEVTKSEKFNGLSAAAIGGIGASTGAGTIVILSVLLIWFCYLKPRRSKKKQEAADKTAAAFATLKPELDGTALEISPAPIYEADGRKIFVVPLAEIGENEIQHIYELGTGEDIAHEFADTSSSPRLETREKLVGLGRK